LLEARGIKWINGSITSIDPATRSISVGGRRIEADALVVALGAQMAVDKVPGFHDYAVNVYSHEAVPYAAEAVRNFKGGILAIGIFGAPYQCPPAPYEIALTLNEVLHERGIDASIEVFSPQPMSLPLLGQATCSLVEGRLEEHGIHFTPNHKATRVEKNLVIFEDGSRLRFELLLGVPPHVCPAIVVQSGLTDGKPWIPVNPRTLETKFPGVYAIGDVTMIPLANGQQLPKAGVFAEGEGKIVAERIAAVFAGKDPEATFAGEGYCFMEIGGGEAQYVRGNFLAEPAPEITLTEPSSQTLIEKRNFEAEHLKAWFGN
ncbi:MAG TPA: FAD/NAD(P)-binding oxidoreductase, partial [Anaerolineae bacterium]|nr:FAD/NAD(P)-binding oxidoreductase [Anaerolineae bacterium]